MKDRQEDEPKQDFLEKRCFSWAALLILLIATLVAFLLAYLITAHNLPVR